MFNMDSLQAVRIKVSGKMLNEPNHTASTLPVSLNITVSANGKRKGFPYSKGLQHSELNGGRG
jgi:hypothetical protein